MFLFVAMFVACCLFARRPALDIYSLFSMFGAQDCKDPGPIGYGTWSMVPTEAHLKLEAGSWKREVGKVGENMHGEKETAKWLIDFFLFWTVSER